MIYRLFWTHARFNFFFRIIPPHSVISDVTRFLCCTSALAVVLGYHTVSFILRISVRDAVDLNKRTKKKSKTHIDIAMWAILAWSACGIAWTKLYGWVTYSSFREDNGRAGSLICVLTEVGFSAKLQEQTSLKSTGIVIQFSSIQCLELSWNSTRFPSGSYSFT